MNNISKMSINTDLRPVFIGGCDRSGTTLLGSMLGDKNDHICPPESLFKDYLFRKYRPEYKLNEEEIINSLHKLKKSIRFMGWNLAIDENDLTRKIQGKTVSSFICELIDLYAGQHLNKKGGSIWIDHSPNNIAMIPFLIEYFPDASFIHIVRDARAVVASLLNMDWGPSNIITACYYWLTRIGQALASEKFNPKVKIITIRYEDLILNPDTEINRLCSEAHLSYSSTMLLGKGMLKNHLLSKNSHSSIGKKLDPGKINSWRKKLTVREIEIIESICADMLVNYGYEVDYGIKARPANQKERVEIMRKEIISKFSNYLSQKKLKKKLFKRFGMENTK